MKIGEAIMAIKMMNLTGAHPFLHWEEMMEVRDMAISALREQGERRWIPVTERLPDNEGDFIVTANDSITGLFVVKDHCYKGTDGKMQFLNHIDGNLYHNHDGELKRHTRNITAWMPLPEPYKEDEHD